MGATVKARLFDRHCKAAKAVVISSNERALS